MIIRKSVPCTEETSTLKNAGTEKTQNRILLAHNFVPYSNVYDTEYYFYIMYTVQCTVIFGGPGECRLTHRAT